MKSLSKYIEGKRNAFEKFRKAKGFYDKGVAGLEVLLSLIIMLFVIGFLVMIFALMGGELQDSVEGDVTNNATAVRVINDTYTEIANVTDWFGIIIVIGAMVVLILLTVIIISAIRGTGLVGGLRGA